MLVPIGSYGNQTDGYDRDTSLRGTIAACSGSTFCKKKTVCLFFSSATDSLKKKALSLLTSVWHSLKLVKVP